MCGSCSFLPHKLERSAARREQAKAGWSPRRPYLPDRHADLTGIGQVGSAPAARGRVVTDIPKVTAQTVENCGPPVVLVVCIPWPWISRTPPTRSAATRVSAGEPAGEGVAKPVIRSLLRPLRCQTWPVRASTGKIPGLPERGDWVPMGRPSGRGPEKA